MEVFHRRAASRHSAPTLLSIGHLARLRERGRTIPVVGAPYAAARERAPSFGWDDPTTEYPSPPPVGGAIAIRATVVERPRGRHFHARTDAAVAVFREVERVVWSVVWPAVLVSLGASRWDSRPLREVALLAVVVVGFGGWLAAVVSAAT